MSITEIFGYHLVRLQVPGVPIMYLAGRKYSVERLPEATLGRGMYSSSLDCNL